MHRRQHPARIDSAAKVAALHAGEKSGINVAALTHAATKQYDPLMHVSEDGPHPRSQCRFVNIEPRRRRRH